MDAKPAERAGGGVTARELARMIGVSQSAVSRAFTPGASISADMRQRILASAAKLGYRPNAIASSLSKRSSKLIGVVLPDLRNPFYPAFLEKLLLALEQAGHQGLVINGPPEGDMEDQLAGLTQYNIETVIIASARVSTATALNWSRNGRSALLFNRPVANVPVASVCCDNAAGARAIADHFNACGYRKVAYVAGPQDMPANTIRQNAFITRVAELGMTLSACIVGGSYGYEIGHRHGVEAARSGADAIFFANDITALGGLDAIRDIAGLRVPEDIGVAGFDDITMASWPRHQLTTLRQPLDEMIAIAVEMLVNREGAQPLPPTMRLVAGELVARNTTRTSADGRSRSTAT
ncbi:substrate-binding domain-containing protein [Terrarubrum flagellatum]|uniref:LacI family DNA-binding transcriptional regulator n=1 Tax=Terrirubrum flagellatum TaxID=2895980 RepID=UPI003144FEAB